MASLASPCLVFVRAALAVTFLLSVAGKAMSPSAFASGLRWYGIPAGARGATAVGVIAAELAAGSAVLIGGPLLLPGLAFDGVLLLLFSAALLRLLRSGTGAGCGCSGVHGARATWLDVGRNVVLLAVVGAGLAGVLGQGSSGEAGAETLASHWWASPAVSLGAGVLGAAFAWLLPRLTLARAVGSNQDPWATRLPVGAPLPHFAATTLDGREVTRARLSGGRAVLVFVSPDCAPCVEALPEYLGLMGRARSCGVELLVISGGDVDETRRMVERACSAVERGEGQAVLVAPRGSNPLWERLRVPGTPYYLLAEDGRVAAAGTPSRRVSEWRVLVERWERAATSPVDSPVGGL